MSKADSATDMQLSSKCPECSKLANQAFRPFCSKRCADLDLGKWFNEEYQLAGDTEIPDNIEEQ